MTIATGYMPTNYRDMVATHKANLAFTPEELDRIGAATRHAGNLVEWGYQTLYAFYERYFPRNTEDLEAHADVCPGQLAGQLCAILYLFKLARIELNTLSDDRNVELYELLSEANATLHYLDIRDT